MQTLNTILRQIFKILALSSLQYFYYWIFMNNVIKKIKKKIKKLERLFLHIPRKIRLKKLINRDYSIISNNCWWWFVYEYFGIEYKTPFIWLFLFPECYLDLLENIQYFLSKELTFIKITESKYYDKIKLWKNLGYPVGLLDGKIEVHFLHYLNEEEAREKWNRRKNRINYNNILIKFSEWKNMCPALVKRFDNLIFKNRICFSYNTKYAYKSIFCIRKRNQPDWKNEWIETKKTLNLIKVLNQLKQNTWMK